MRSICWGAVASLIAATAPASAQQVEALGRPVAELDEPFSRVAGIRELSDGRVLVSDSRERLLHLVNLSTGAMQRLSREGAGPLEFRSLGPLLSMPGGETMLVDAGNRRYLRISATGEPIGTVGMPALPVGQVPAPMAQMAALSLLPPHGADTLGRVYFTPIPLPVPGQSPPDSLPVLRWEVGASRVDSVGWALQPPSEPVFGPVTAWQVAPDGRLARITPDPYRVTWTDRAGRGVPGPAVSYAPIRVTEAERQAEREARAGRQDQMMAAAGAAMRAQMAQAFPDPVFAATKPPFQYASSVVTDPSGRLWVLRTRAHGDPVPVYDIFDSTGRLERRVSLAAGSRLVGFGPRSVYVVRTNEDDLEYLQKFNRPGR